MVNMKNMKFKRTIQVGNRDVSLEAHSIQDLEELADVSMLWDVRDRAESRQETDG